MRELTKVRLRLRSAHSKGCPEESEKVKRHAGRLANMLLENASLLLLLLLLLLAACGERGNSKSVKIFATRNPK
jgi:hypothetical protein